MPWYKEGREKVYESLMICWQVSWGHLVAMGESDTSGLVIDPIFAYHS